MTRAQIDALMRGPVASYPHAVWVAVTEAARRRVIEQAKAKAKGAAK